MIRGVLLGCVVVAFTGLASSPEAGAQEYAPLSQVLVDAETAFIQNMSAYPDAADELYKQLKDWGRFEIVSDINQADLTIIVDVGTSPAGEYAIANAWTNGRGYATGSQVSIPLTSVHAFVYVFDTQTQVLLWQDTEPVGLRRYKTAEKVVGRLRARVQDSERNTVETRRAPRPQQRQAELTPSSTTTKRPYAPGTEIPAGMLPEEDEPLAIASLQVDWTYRTGDYVGYRWHVVIDNHGAAPRTALLIATLHDAEGEPIFQDRHEVEGSIPPETSGTVEWAGEIPETVGLRSSHWTMEVSETALAPGRTDSPSVGHAAQPGDELGEPFEATGRLIGVTRVVAPGGIFIASLPNRTYVRITRRSATFLKIETEDGSVVGWVRANAVRVFGGGRDLEGSGEPPESDARQLVEDAQSAPSGDSWASAFRMGEEGLESPVLVHKELPEYTAAAKRAGISGEVYIEAVVTEEGTVVDPVLIRGLSDPELNRRAMESILLWRFEPGLKDGQPVPVIVLFTVTFRLHQDSLPPGSRDIGIVTGSRN